MVDPKPHAVYVTSPKPASGAQGVVEETVQEGGVLVEGQLSPLASGYALERYGVEALRPHQFLVDPDDARHFRRRGRCEGRAAGVDLTGRHFEVAALPEVHEYGQWGDCAVVVLEEVG